RRPGDSRMVGLPTGGFLPRSRNAPISSQVIDRKGVMRSSKNAAKQSLEALRSVPLFANLSDRELGFVARQAKEVHFPAGREICKEGEMGAGMHVVLEGETKVKIKGRTRRRMGPGAFFGEIAVLDGGPRSATVVAETDVHTLSIPFWNFKSLMKEHPAMSLKMLEEVCRRLRDEGPGLES
ncbi:MAG TPA: cyclic nucleotide-binding domain-containing protein, partial [Actinomycetota bacterium]|nr:cyclic nucleotide-binding domain-containing protein [Actinomycetota bacterium]